MTEIQKISDYKDSSQYLIQQYKDKEKFFALINGLLDRGNAIEGALFEIRDNYTIDTAKGVQLDVLGLIQGETRKGFNDDDYRNNIKTRIIVNNGSGEASTIIAYLKGLCGASKVQLQTLGNMNLYIWTDIYITEFIFSQLQVIAESGVTIFSLSGDVGLRPFVTSESDGTEDPDGDGLTEAKEDDVLEFTDGTIKMFTDGVIEVYTDSTGSDQTMGGALQEVRSTE